MSFCERVADFLFGGGWEEWLGELVWRLCWWLHWLLPAYYANSTQGFFSDIFRRLGYDEDTIMTDIGGSKVRKIVYRKR